ncbi:MAG: hypothetical protein N2254_09490 [bacterium]|nr:hypothetical protein [bacterium]
MSKNIRNKKSNRRRTSRSAQPNRIRAIEEAIAKLIKQNMETSKQIQRTSEENNLAIQRLHKENELAIQRLREENNLAIQRFSEESKLAISKLSEENRKTSEELRLFKESVKRITDSWGRFVEGMVEPSVIKFLEAQGFKILEILPRAKFSKNGKNKEYDLIVVCNKNSVFMISAKTHASSKDVKELLLDMKELSFFGQRYEGMKLYGIIAGMSYGKGADVFALRSGLYVMKASGEIMHVQTPKKVKFVSL